MTLLSRSAFLLLTPPRSLFFLHPLCNLFASSGLLSLRSISLFRLFSTMGDSPSGGLAFSRFPCSLATLFGGCVAGGGAAAPCLRPRVPSPYGRGPHARPQGRAPRRRRPPRLLPPGGGVTSPDLCANRGGAPARLRGRGRERILLPRAAAERMRNACSGRRGEP